MSKYRIVKVSRSLYRLEKYAGWLWGWELEEVCGSYEEAKSYIPEVFIRG